MRKPPRTVVIPLSAFVDAWPNKPKSEVAVGLRILSEQDLQTARAMAARYAEDLLMSEDGGCTDELSRVEAFNDALMRWAIACAVTDPNNAAVPFFVGGDDVVRVALSSQGVRYLWDHLERVHLELSPVVAEASDEDLERLAGTLHRVGALPKVTQRRLRKLLGFCLSEMGDTLSGLEDATDEAPDGVPVYHVKE